MLFTTLCYLRDELDVSIVVCDNFEAFMRYLKKYSISDIELYNQFLSQFNEFKIPHVIL